MMESLSLTNSRVKHLVRQLIKYVGLWVLLLSVVVTRGMIPAGTMPSALGAGSPWMLCPSDSGSALLIELFPSEDAHAHHHHSHHHHSPQHDSHSSHHQGHASTSDKSCEFSALGSIATVSFTISIGESLPDETLPLLWPNSQAYPYRLYQRPPARAPPSSITT